MSYTKYKIPFPFVDIYFIVWQPNAISKIHNHSENGCHMFIIKGLLKEELYNKELSLIDINYYGSLEKSYIDDKIGYHKIKNSNQYTFSIHIYHPKNHITQYYDL
tara:strand:+ start:505 stop:819 length:315 start_codon:yes stop_codon:yes gene_type:complete